jgi:methyl-accepting chemotaxis protein
VNFNNLKIGTRLIIGFSLTLCLSLLISLVGIKNLKNVGGLSEEMVDQVLVKERLLTEWQSLTKTNGLRMQLSLENKNELNFDKLNTLIKKSSERISDIQKKLDLMPKTNEEKKLYENMANKRNSYKGLREKL